MGISSERIKPGSSAALVIGLALLTGSRLMGEDPQQLAKVSPVEIQTPLPNPFMGWGIWAGPRQYGYNEEPFSVQANTAGFGDDAPLFNWVLIDWDWASIEPTEGQPNWKDFDAVVDYWKARHKQFVIRFWVTDDAGWNGHPGAPVLPEWIWVKGLRHDEYKGNGRVIQREPLYAAP